MVGATATSAHKEVDSDIASLLFPDLAKSSNDKSKKKRGMTGQVSFWSAIACKTQADRNSCFPL